MAGDLRHIKLWKQLEEKAKEAAKTRRLSEETIEAAEQIIKEAKGIDANVAEVTALLTEATSALADKDYKLAFEKGTECREKALKVYKDRIRSILDSSKNLLGFIKSIKGDVSAEESSINLAEEAFQKEEFTDSIELAKESWKRFEKTLHEELNRMFSTAQSLIMTAKKSGKDIKTAEDILLRAREAMDSSDYEMAINSTKECLESVGSALKDEVQLIVDEVKALIELAREVDFDVKRLESSVERTQAELDKYSYEAALNYAKQAKADSERILKSAISSKLASFPTKIREAEKLDADVSSVKKALEEARKALKDDDTHQAISLIRDADETIENAKFEIVLHTISLLRNKFVTAANAGADITKALEILNRARDALKEGKFDEALKLAESSEHEINGVLKEYEEVEDEIKSVQRSFALGDILGVDTTGYRNKLAEAQRALKEKDYEKYVEMVKKTREEVEKSLSEKTHENLEHSRFYIEMGEKMGIELAEIKGILESSVSHAKAKEYTEAVSISKDVRARAEEKLREHITKTIANLKETIEAPILKKEDVLMFNELITNAESALNAAEYEKAFTFAHDGSEKLGHKLFSELKNLMFAVENAVNVARDLNVNVDSYTAKLSEGKEALEDKRYKDVLPIVIEVANSLASDSTTIFSDLKEKLVKIKKMKMDIKDFLVTLKEAAAFKKEGNLLGTYQKLHETNKKISTILDKRKTAYDNISSCAIMIAEAKKKNIEVKDVVEKLLEAKRLYQIHAYSESIKLTDDIKLETKHQTDQFTANQRIQALNEKLEIAKELNIEPSEVSINLNKAVEALKNNDFGKALEFANKVDLEITEAIRNELSTTLSTLQTSISEAKEIGIDIGIAEEHLARSYELLETDSYRDAATSALSAKEELSRLKELSKNAASLIKKAQDAVNETESMNISVPNQRKLLEESIQLLDSNSYEQAIECAERVLMEVEKESNNFVSKTIVKFKEVIKKAGQDGINTKTSESLIDKAVKAYKEKRHKEALELAMRSEKEIERVGLQQDMAQKALSTAQRKIESVQFPTSKAEELLVKGKEVFDQGDYIKALEYAIQTGDEVYKVMALYDDTMDKLGSATKLMNLGYKIGLKIQKEEEWLKKANASLETGNLEIANQMAEKCVTKIRSSITEEFNNDTLRCEELLNLAKNLGIDITTHVQKISDVKKLLGDENIEAAHNVLDQEKKELDRLFSAELRKMVKNTSAMIAHANKMGAKTTKSEKLLEEATKALSEKNYVRVVELIEESELNIEGKEARETKFMELSLEADTAISTLNRYGIELRNAEKMLNEATDIKEADIESAIALVLKSLELAEQAKEEYIPDLEATLTIREPKLNEWSNGELKIENHGKALAKDIVIEILGDAELEPVMPIKLIKVGGEIVVPIRIKLTSSGSVPLALKIDANRILDDTIYTFEQLEDIDVPAEGEQKAEGEQESEQEKQDEEPKRVKPKRVL